MIRKFYIKNKAGVSQTLVKLISKHLKLSLDDARCLIIQGSVWNNNNLQRLKNPDAIITDELIQINLPEFPVIPYTFDGNEIAYEDKYILAVYKKAGFPTVPTPYADIHSLEFALNNFYSSRSERLYPINRIDMPTEGIVLFSRDKQSAGQFYKLFSSREVLKCYQVTTELSRHPAGATFVFTDKLEFKGEVKEAKTLVKHIGNEDNKSCYLAYPLTGRTHQIRKHFAMNLSPIIGDATYGNYKSTDKLMLSCIYYRFIHPITKIQIRIKHPAV